MRKVIKVLFSMCVFSFILVSNLFCQEINSSFNPSSNPANLSPLLGTKWNFNITEGENVLKKSFEFGSNITFDSDGTAKLSCKNITYSSGATSYVFYGGLPSQLGGGNGFTISFPSDSSTTLYSFKITEGTGTDQISIGKKALYVFYTDSYLIHPLEGKCTYAPSTQPTVRDSDCVVTPKSLTMNIDHIPTTQESVQFTVDAVSDCATTNFYYHYSYAPDYGTVNYDGNRWVNMLSGDGFTTNKSISYNFPLPGYYVLVAWVTKERAVPTITNLIGMTVKVK